MAARASSAVEGNASIIFLMVAQVGRAAYSDGGGILWQKQRQKGKLAQIVRK